MGPKQQFTPFQARRHYGSPFFGFLVACALVLVTGFARVALMQTLGYKAPFILFYPAIATAAFLGGVSGGLLAVIGGAIFASTVFPVSPEPFSWIALSVIGPILASGFAHLRELHDQSVDDTRDRARFRFISDNATDWLFLLGDENVITYVNQTAAQQLGYRPEYVIGQPFANFTPEPNRQQLNLLLDNCRSSQKITTEIEMERRDRSVLKVEAGCTAVETEGETIIHLAARDITARHQIEERLREAQKWESLGVLAGGLAHDFNNLLTAIMGNAALAREYLEPNHPAAQFLESVQQAGDRSAELVRLMLATAGWQSLKAENIRISKLLEQTLASYPLPPHVSLRSEILTESYRGDAQSFKTMLGGLITNAAESYGNRAGEILVRITEGPVMPRMGTASFEEGSILGTGPVLGIIVEDHGCGMDPQVLSRAFDPFYSTKFTGRGLGLAAIRGLVRANSGKLWLTTEPGKGTRVEIWLPDQRPNSTSSARATSS